MYLKHYIFSLFLLFGNSGIYAQKITINNTIEIDQDDNEDSIITKAAHVVPTDNQWAALKDEFIAFIHFGPNTFTRKEWGNGMENPLIFNLRELDTDQWCRVMQEAGMKKVILTVKHHDGFVLWQSRYTDHGIMSSPFQDGKGDILEELAQSCKKYGLKLGIYLSPADLYQIESQDGLYGNLSNYSMRTIPRSVPGRPFENKTTFKFEVDDYNEYFLNQLFELLTEYGPIHEVWFDGAHPKRKGGQKYKYAAWKELIQTLAPEAVIFGRQDIRWCGNESGKTRKTEWNIIPYKNDPNKMNRFDDLTAKSLGSRRDLLNGNYLHYQQAETNTSIREGWFYRDDDQQNVRSADDVFDIYERSVGGNSTFLLNIPPNRKGRFSSEDVLVLLEVGNRIKSTYGINQLSNAIGPNAILDNHEGTSLQLEEGQTISLSSHDTIEINRFIIREDIRQFSERIEEHVLEAKIDGTWTKIARGTNVGYKRILRFPKVRAKDFRIKIVKSRLSPSILEVSAHYYDANPPMLSIERNVEGVVSIAPVEHEFNWKPHGETVHDNLSADIEIFYSMGELDPVLKGKKYTGPFFAENTTINAVARDGDRVGSTSARQLGFVKKAWKILESSGKEEGFDPLSAIDGDADTYWMSKLKDDNYIIVDLNKGTWLKSFEYTPPLNFKGGMIEKGRILLSTDNVSWREVGSFDFGNLINDPTPRTFEFPEKVLARYLKVEIQEIAGGFEKAAIAELDLY